MGHISNRKKLLIAEFREANPAFPIEEIHNYFGLSEGIVNGIFTKGYILIPSKLNRNDKKKSNKK